MVYIKPLLQLVSQSLLPKSNLRNMILRFVSSFSPILCLKRSRVHVHVKLILVYSPWILVEFLGILLFVILKGVVPKMILPTVTQQLKPELPLDSPAVNQQYPVSKNRNCKPSAWNHEVGTCIEVCEEEFFFNNYVIWTKLPDLLLWGFVYGNFILLCTWTCIQVYFSVLSMKNCNLVLHTIIQEHVHVIIYIHKKLQIYMLFRVFSYMYITITNKQNYSTVSNYIALQYWPKCWALGCREQSSYCYILRSSPVSGGQPCT